MTLHFIALTGGPGGGKTTLINELLSDPVWRERLLALSEAIPLMRHLGVSPREKRFQRLMFIAVDGTLHCRAWRMGEDVNAPPADCPSLYRRAASHLRAALEALEIPRERWDAVTPANETIRLSDYQTTLRR